MNIDDKLIAAGLSAETCDRIHDALDVWGHIADERHTEAQQPSTDAPIREMEDGPGIGNLHSYIPEIYRIVHVSGLHRSVDGGFHSWTGERLNNAMNLLQAVGVVSGVALSPSVGGRPRQVRFFDNAHWGFESGETVEALENKLTDFLISVPVGTAPPAVMAETVTVVEPAPIIEPVQAECPECKIVFAVTADEPLVIFTADCWFENNGSMVTRTKGQVSDDYRMNRTLIIDTYTYAVLAGVGEAAVCPRRHAFLLPQVLGDPVATQALREQYLAQDAARELAEAPQREARRLAEEQSIANQKARMSAEAAEIMRRAAVDPAIFGRL